jgi:hypothetical protein
MHTKYCRFMGEEDVEVWHGEDGIWTSNLAAVVNLLDYPPLVDNGDIPSNDKNEIDP